MNIRIGLLSAAALTAAVMSAPLALAANTTPPDAFMKKAIQGNLAEIKGHEKTIAKYSKEAKASNSPAATYASTSLPVLHKHLRLAQALEHNEPRG
jgi:hypothetical protein